MTILTNAHTHLELGWLADACPGVSGQPFVSWLTHLVERRWRLGSDWRRIYEAAIEDGILELLASGATHVGDITATGISIGPLLASGLKGIVYVEVLGLDEAQADERLNQARAIIDAWRPKERSDMRVGLSIHAPYSVHPVLWEKALDYARREALPLCIHVAESAAEYDYLSLDTGPLVDEYYLALNLSPIRAPMVTPVQYLDNLGALELKPLLVHTIHVAQEDVLRIAANDCSVVHCPR